MDAFRPYETAVSEAEDRAARSYFDHYVVTDKERGFLVLNEGDYGLFPDHRIDDIVYCARAGLLDEY